MPRSAARQFQKHLENHDLTPQKFARLSGMPLAEVRGILQGALPITKIRANHLAAIFNTEAEFWTNFSEG